MKISERIALHKLGYSKEEIAAMIEEEKNADAPQSEVPQEETKTEEPKHNDYSPTGNTAILEAINNLTNAIQASNIKKEAQPEQPEKTADEILMDAMKKF